MKQVLFVCGTGGITSAVAENRVVEACTDAGLAVHTKRCTPASIDSNLDGIDLIVSTTYLAGTYPVEVVNALSLITGIGSEAVLNEIVSKLR